MSRRFAVALRGPPAALIASVNVNLNPNLLSHLAAKVGAIGFDPSFPVHYGIVKTVPAAQAAAALFIGLTLRPDGKKAD